MPLSPSVRRLLEEHSIAAADIEGTGRDGRITAQDVTRHVADAGTKRRAGAIALRERRSRRRAARGLPHTAIRRRVADHMARSLLEAPHVTHPCSKRISRGVLGAQRRATRPSTNLAGARLTLTAYFVSACVHALRAHREVNCHISSGCARVARGRETSAWARPSAIKG